MIQVGWDVPWDDVRKAGFCAKVALMTDATFLGTAQLHVENRATDTPLPKPQPFGAPVFMSDAITPLCGETLLSLLWKRLEKTADNDA